VSIYAAHSIGRDCENAFGQGSGYNDQGIFASFWLWIMRKEQGTQSLITLLEKFLNKIYGFCREAALFDMTICRNYQRTGFWSQIDQNCNKLATHESIRKL